MLKSQINALTEAELEILVKIEEFEANLKKLKRELSAIKKAKQQLERLDGKLNGSTTVSY